MADRRVKVIFSAEIQNYKAAMSEAAKATEQTKKASEDAGKASEKSSKVSADAAKLAAEAQKKHADAVESVTRVAAVGGAAVVAGVGLAVKAYADFDKQMSQVDAATHETTENMALLREAAVRAGADTAFSAGEAAQGIEEMAKAGISTRDILAGGLDGALALAAAGALGVGEASEIAASAMTQFKLSGDKLPHVADLLAAGAGKAQGSVQDLGAALKQSGLVASQVGLTIEETTGGLSAFAAAGLVGSDAGTAFKSMLQRLTPQSKEAKNLMADLGLSAYDAQGNFIGLSEYAGELQKALGGMTVEQRNATMGTLFGSDAIRAAAVLYENGAEGVQKWEDAVNDAGYAADTAARMQNNLAGDLEKLGGAFDTALIQSGSGANDVLRGLVQGAEAVVDAIGKVPGPVLSAGAGLAAVAGGAVVLGAGLITVVPKIAATREALNLLAPAGSRANVALSRTGKFAAGAAVGITAVATAAAAATPLLEKIGAPTGETGDALEAFGGQAAQGAIGADTLNKSFQDLIEQREGVGAFQTAIEGIADPGFWGNLDNIVVGGIKVLSLGMADVSSTSEKARERFKAFGVELASVDAEKAAESFQSMAEATDGSDEKLRQLLDLMPSYREKLADQAKAAGLATDDQSLLNIAMGKTKLPADEAKGAIEGVGIAADGATGPTEDMAEALAEIGVEADGSIGDLDKFQEALLRATGANLSARDAARGYQESIDAIAASVTKNGTSLDINTEKGRNNQAALDAIAGSGLKVVEANARNSESQETLQGNLGTTYQDLINAAGAFGITDQAAIDLAREILKVPKDVNIDTWMSDEAKRMAESTRVAIEWIPSFKNVAINVQYTETGTAIRDRATDAGMSNMAQGFATGGRLPAFSGGGQLPTTGPGTGMTDGFLGVDSLGVPRARVDAGEWIINGNSSNRYNRELAAINAGTFPKLPGFAGGGREFAAQSFTSSGHGAVSVSAPAVTVMIGNEQLDARTYRVASAAISAADSQSQFSRRGR